MQPEISKPSLYVAGAAFGAALGYAAWSAFLKKKFFDGFALFSKSWFTEQNVMWPGQALSLQIEKVVFEGKSKFQQIKIFDSATYGRVLVLDGVIQVTEKDEFAYQEMLAHVGLFSHADPKRVLVIGGGDGGVLREIARHPGVEQIEICELDEMVIATCREYMPFVAKGFDDPRVEIVTDDGLEFLKRRRDCYDVIIVDSSDPIGPADSLYSDDFYGLLHAALTPQGIAVTQAECMWLQSGMEIIRRLHRFSRTRFSHTDYSYISIPSYPCGTIGLLCLAKGDHSAAEPLRTAPPDFLEPLRYYSPAVHRAAFVLPAFLAREVGHAD